MHGGLWRNDPYGKHKLLEVGPEKGLTCPSLGLDEERERVVFVVVVGTKKQYTSQ